MLRNGFSIKMYENHATTHEIAKTATNMPSPLKPNLWSARIIGI